uniref:Uncharacterized protein n=1 Tax=Arundo donax TaxID=35708 RepID=A0A0A9AUB8_ARUDO
MTVKLSTSILIEQPIGVEALPADRLTLPGTPSLRATTGERRELGGEGDERNPRCSSRNEVHLLCPPQLLTACADAREMAMTSWTTRKASWATRTTS